MGDRTRRHSGACRTCQTKTMHWSALLDHMVAVHGIDPSHAPAQIMARKFMDGPGISEAFFLWRFSRDVGFVEVEECIHA